VIDRVEWQLPTFAKVSHNMTTAVALLDMLPAPSTDGVGERYHWMKNILSTAAALQIESPIQHRVKASVLTPVLSKDGGQRATQGALELRPVSSLARISS
jgi:hypothetical protein